MTKKTPQRKRMLGKRLNQSRRIPVLAMVRTHRRIQQNRSSRNWRSNKIKKE